MKLGGAEVAPPLVADIVDAAVAAVVYGRDGSTGRFSLQDEQFP